MAEKTLREFSAPSTKNIRVGPTFNLSVDAKADLQTQRANTRFKR